MATKKKVAKKKTTLNKRSTIKGIEVTDAMLAKIQAILGTKSLILFACEPNCDRNSLKGAHIMTNVSGEQVMAFADSLDELVHKEAPDLWKQFKLEKLSNIGGGLSDILKKLSR